MIDCVAEKIAVAALPKLFAGFRIETGDRFLQFRPVPDVAHDIELPVGYDGRGLAGQIGRPQRLLNVHPVRQALFARGAVLVRPAPGEPALDRPADGCARGQDGKDCQQNESVSQKQWRGPPACDERPSPRRQKYRGETPQRQAGRLPHYIFQTRSERATQRGA